MDIIKRVLEEMIDNKTMVKDSSSPYNRAYIIKAGSKYDLLLDSCDGYKSWYPLFSKKELVIHLDSQLNKVVLNFVKTISKKLLIDGIKVEYILEMLNSSKLFNGDILNDEEEILVSLNDIKIKVELEKWLNGMGLRLEQEAQGLKKLEYQIKKLELKKAQVEQKINDIR